MALTQSPVMYHKMQNEVYTSRLLPETTRRVQCKCADLRIACTRLSVVLFAVRTTRQGLFDLLYQLFFSMLWQYTLQKQLNNLFQHKI